MSMSEVDAARVLQRLGRGYRGRHAFLQQFASKIKVTRMVRRLRFVKRIQPICNGYRLRRDLIKNIQEAAARPVKVLQRFGRAFRVRREVARDVLQWKARRLRISTVLQCNLRALRARKRAAIQIRKLALRLLQSSCRGFFGRRAAFDLILKRLRKRQQYIALMQRAGRAMRVRVDCYYARITMTRERRKMFVFTTARLFRALKVRVALGRRRSKVIRENRMRLGLLAQRVGQGYLERCFLGPQLVTKKQRNWLDHCAAIVQRCTRGFQARRWLHYLHELAEGRKRKSKIHRSTVKSAALNLQRVGRAFMKRRVCFRRLWRAGRAKQVVAACAIGAIVRMRLFAQFKRPIERSVPRLEDPGGDDDRALMELRRINIALRDQLTELQWRFNDLLLLGVSATKYYKPAAAAPTDGSFEGGSTAAAAAGTNSPRPMDLSTSSRFDVMRVTRGVANPIDVYEKRVERMRLKNASLRAKLVNFSPEAISSLTIRLTEIERQRGALMVERDELRREKKAMAPDVADADVELTILAKEQTEFEAETKKILARTATLHSKIDKLNRETGVLTEQCDSIETKLANVDEFEDEARPMSSRTLKRRADRLRRMPNAGRSTSVLQSSASFAAGSPTNTLRRTVHGAPSSVTPPPRLTEARDDRDRLTYHFSDDDEDDEQRRRSRHVGGSETGGPPLVALPGTALGVCVPMVFSPTAKMAGGMEKSILGGAGQVVSSPIRSIRIVRRANPTSTLALLDTAEASSSLTLNRFDSSAAFSPKTSGATTTEFRPHVVIRTKADALYVKMQLAEADSVIAQLRLEIDRGERELLHLQQVDSQHRAARAVEERQRQIELDQAARREKDRRREEKLHAKLAALKAIAEAEREAAAATALRAEAERRLREELAQSHREEVAAAGAASEAPAGRRKSSPAKPFASSKRDSTRSETLFASKDDATRRRKSSAASDNPPAQQRRGEAGSGKGRAGGSVSGGQPNTTTEDRTLTPPPPPAAESSTRSLSTTARSRATSQDTEGSGGRSSDDESTAATSGDD